MIKQFKGYKTSNYGHSLIIFFLFAANASRRFTWGEKKKKKSAVMN